MIDIQPMSNFDLGEVTQLWNNAFSDYFVPINMDQTDFKNRIDTLFLSSEYSLVAVSDGQLVGILLYGEKDFQGVKQGWIGGMAVVPDYRDKGIAKQLMSVAIQHGKQSGLDELLLEVIRDNSKAVALYQQLGFKPISTVINGKIDLTSFNLEPTKKVTLESARVPSDLYHFAAEKTIWQNRLGTPGDVSLIKKDDTVIGFIFYLYDKEKKKFIIKQLVSFEENDTFLMDIFASLSQQFDVNTCYFSNMDQQDPLVSQLLPLSFQEEISQIQMIKTY